MRTLRLQENPGATGALWRIRVCAAKNCRFKSLTRLPSKLLGSQEVLATPPQTPPTPPSSSAVLLSVRLKGEVLSRHPHPHPHPHPYQILV